MDGPAASPHFETSAAAALPSRPAAPWRWPTVIFAAVPATVLAFPAALAILLGGTALLSLKPVALALFFCGVCGWAGMLALWSAARTPYADVVSRRTAWGLIAGIVSVLIYYGFELFGDDLDTRLWASTPLLTTGPLLFALSYLKRYRQRPRPRPRAVDRPASTIQDPETTPRGVLPPFPATPPSASASGGTAIANSTARPFNEGRMRRILALLFIVPVLLELIFVPPQFDVRPGLGTLLIIVGVFPFYLGIAVTAVWSFWRSRSHLLRGLAAAALVTPIALPYILRALASRLGQEAIEKAAIDCALAIPLLLLLLIPKGVAGYLPSFMLRSRRWARAWTAVLTLMLVPWAVLAIWFRPLKETATQASFNFLIGYTVASIVVGGATLVTAYLALRSQPSALDAPVASQWRQTRQRIAQIVLSLLLLLIGGAVAMAILFLFSLAGLG